jgi:predicted nucleic acid-binding protein
MSYVLDTTVVSALMRGEPTASARLLATPPPEVAIPQPVVAELEYGLARLPRSRRRRMLEERWHVLLHGLGRVLWSDEVSRCFGNLKTKLESRGRQLAEQRSEGYTGSLAQTVLCGLELMAVPATWRLRTVRRP